MPDGSGGMFEEQWKLQHTFRSQVATSLNASATPLWTIATIPARTVGGRTYIYTIKVRNHGLDEGTMILEVAGAPIFPPIVVAKGAEPVIDLKTPINVGNNDVNYHASQVGMDVQILGLEV